MLFRPIEAYFSDKTESQSGPVCVIAFEFDTTATHSVYCLMNCLTTCNQMHSANVKFYNENICFDLPFIGQTIYQSINIKFKVQWTAN